MATKIVKRSTGKPEQFTVEEKNLVGMYRQLSRWEKNAVFLTLQSMAWGSLGESTDGQSWPEMRNTLGVNRHGFAYREEAHHG